jgi:uncharacterized membrane protein YbhN (UPF0104 family)
MARLPLHIYKLRERPDFQQMLESRRRAADEEERSKRRVFALCLLSFAVWTAAAVLIAVWGMQTIRFAPYSQTILEVGVLLGLAGILCMVLFSYDRLGR